MQSVKDYLKKCFKFRDLGPTSWLLGVEITRNRAERSLSLSQRQYIISLLERFNLSDCNSVTTLMDPSVKLSASMLPSSQEDIAAMGSLVASYWCSDVSCCGHTSRHILFCWCLGMLQQESWPSTLESSKTPLSLPQRDIGPQIDICSQPIF